MQLSPDGEYVDWRRFLLEAAQPWPVPSEQDLLDALAALHVTDQSSTGYVTREQFEQVAASSGVAKGRGGGTLATPLAGSRPALSLCLAV